MEEWKRKFYGSRQWKEVRNIVLNSSKGVCNTCGKLVIGKHSVHHSIVLDNTNYMDPNISLNPELLVLLCETCHNKVHNKLYVPSFINFKSNAINFDERDKKLNPPIKK